MVNTSDSTPQASKSKTAVVRGDNQIRPPTACTRLIALGVPNALADTLH